MFPNKKRLMIKDKFLLITFFFFDFVQIVLEYILIFLFLGIFSTFYLSSSRLTISLIFFIYFLFLEFY